jgi:CRISPR-associated endonuclease/helicase Cas3
MAFSEAGCFFRESFPLLSGISSGAYHWQEELFHRIIENDWPEDICLPTGMGKTSIITIWLLALIWRSLHPDGPRPVPRRLVWVVDRRVVVDQATKEAEDLSKRIQEVPQLEQSIAGLSMTGKGLAVSTLRGELADNGDWRRDPSRPAIIVGTVDMIGSRLLFRGYGDGKWSRPQNAGLLGHDALIVNDESHLTPAFAKLLAGVAEFQKNGAFRVMRLSATPRGSAAQWPSSLETDLQGHETFRRKFDAKKRLVMHAVGRNDFERQIFRIATEEGEATRRLVFIRSPEDAARFAKKLAARVGKEYVALLTGTMRGKERDDLREVPAFQVFLEQSRPEEKYWLVATSAAEVGVNLTSDLLITDLDTADHLIQRFGRLNRFGETEAVAHLVYLNPIDPKAVGLPATLEYFAGLKDGDISCRALSVHPPPTEAISEEPPIAKLDRRLIDLWSQTSVDRSGAVPEVEAWLHGKQDDWPQTEIAWRWDVQYLTRPGVDPEELKNVLRRYPVMARERLREPSSRAKEKLKALNQSTRAICILADGEVQVKEIGSISPGELAYATVLLPEGCGSLERGMFQPVGGGPEAAEYDVADDSARTRPRVDRGAPTEEPGMREVARAGIPPEDAPADSDVDMEFEIVYLRRADAGAQVHGDISLEKHQARVGCAAGQIAEKAGLPADVVQAFQIAAAMHDAGKAEPIWQAAAGNLGEEPVAKPRRRFRPAQLAGFRHEFVSLREAERSGVDDLVLHLIATHHGWARPYFRPRAFDRKALKDSERTALDCARRFGRLQERYGPWKLAYLEAIFKAADAMVSEQEKEQPDYA